MTKTIDELINEIKRRHCVFDDEHNFRMFIFEYAEQTAEYEFGSTHSPEYLHKVQLKKLKTVLRAATYAYKHYPLARLNIPFIDPKDIPFVVRQDHKRK